MRKLKTIEELISNFFKDFERKEELAKALIAIKTSDLEILKEALEKRNE